MIVFYRLEGRDYKEIGRVEDGEIVEGSETLDEIIYRPNLSDEDKLLNAHDGPFILAQIEDENTEKSVTNLLKEDEWIPYEGPEGGEGWQNTNNPEDVRYIEDPPGKIADGYEDMAEGWGEGLSNPDIGDYRIMVNGDEGKEDYEALKPVIEETFEEGQFDGGAVNTDIKPIDESKSERWDLNGETPEVEHATSYDYIVSNVQMPASDYADLQEHIATNLDTWNDEQSFWEETSDERVESLKDGLTGENVSEYYDGVPVPYIKIGSDGTLMDVQEGRHRILAAQELGIDEMPVRVLIDPEEKGEGWEEESDERYSHSGEFTGEIDEGYGTIQRKIIDESISEAETKVDLSSLKNITTECPLRNEENQKNRAQAYYNPDTVWISEDAIGMNANYFDDYSVSGKHFELVSEQSKSLVCHELVHIAHAQVKRETGITSLGWDDEDDTDIIESEISMYAATHPDEFVAEVGSLLLMGEKVSDDILDMYHKYGGPEI